MNIIKGLLSDPTKKEVTTKYLTFCNLCSRKINRQETVYSWPGNQFFVHLDCNDEEVRTRMTNVEFRKNAKNKGSARRGKLKNQGKYLGQENEKARKTRAEKKNIANPLGGMEN